MRLANLWSVAAGRERLCLVANRSRRLRESLVTGEQLRAAAHGMVPFNIFLRSPAFGIINIYIPRVYCFSMVFVHKCVLYVIFHVMRQIIL